MCVANIHLAEFTVEKQNKDLELSINSLNRPYLDKDDNEENGNLTNGLFNFNGFDESDAAIVDEEKGSNWFNVANLEEVALDGLCRLIGTLLVFPEHCYLFFNYLSSSPDQSLTANQC